jgi:hypothetical protein
MLEHLAVIDGICHFRPRGECSLVEAVELINRAIAYCRNERVTKLLVNGTGLVGIPVPSLVDRFLMVEEWAEKAKGMVVVVLVVQPEYIHPQKFGVKVAADFGLIADVYTSETDAFKWLLSVPNPS